MPEINVLDSSIFNRIAAGEVVDRPASIVKELVENSIDAGADRVTVEIRGGGIELIRVSDNGKGLAKDDMPTAFLPHATSKIKSLQDLNGIGTLGFRGEALPSIASVAAVTMTSRREQDELGFFVRYENGSLAESGECGCPLGTGVTVERVFKHVPAREKFLGKPSAEAAQISDLIAKLILANCNVSIRYTVEGKEVYHSAGDGMDSAVYCVYGKDVFRNLDRINGSMPGITLKGFVNKPAYTKHTRLYQTLIVNGRYVSNADIAYYVFLCYQDYLMKRQYPMYVLYLDLPYDMVDVNVHPNKLDVKFASLNVIKSLVMKTIKDYLYSAATEPKDLRLSGGERLPLSEVVSVQTPLPTSETAAARDTGEQIKSDVPYFKIISHIREAKSSGLRESDSLLDKITGSFLNGGDLVRKTVISDVDLADTFSFAESIDSSLDSKESLQVSLFEENDVKDAPPQRKEQPAPMVFDLPNEYKVIGKLFNTYIIVEEGEFSYFIDQHAAHEKLLYDKLVAEYNSGEVVMQDLLVPYVFDVTHGEQDTFTDKLTEINRCGFCVSPLGGLSYSLSAVPLCLADLRLGEFVPAFLSEFNGKRLRNSDLLKDVLMQTACKAAVKGSMDLGASEIDGLLNEMRQQNLTLFCPHGRPIVIKILKSEIEKWFKRIV